MSDVAISVKNLSKFYRLGLKEEVSDTLAGTFFSWAKAPIKNLKRLRDLTRFDSSEGSEDILKALNDVSFEVMRGEVLGIIGRNGAGKSTLLKVLSRITEPTSGCVTINGRVASLLEVGTGFHPELTGRENIYMNGTILGMTKKEIDRKFDEIVDFAGVERFLDTPVKRYSSGMKVRLAFSVAAYLEPEILIIDEVLAVGDAEFQKKCLGKMDDVATRGKTILFVSHQLEAVSKLCNKVIYLQDGKIVEDGETDKVISQYLSFVQNIVIPLYSRVDRIGVGNFRFVDTWLEDIEGNRLSTARTGAPLKIVAKYEAEVAIDLSKLSVSLAIYSQKHIPITNLWNEAAGCLFSKKTTREGQIECFIETLPLNQGTYYYNLQAMVFGQVEDWVENAALLSVESGDFYGTGKLPDSKRLVMFEHSWGAF